MIQRLLLCGARVCSLVAVVVSVLLFVYYLAPAASDLCGGSSGCEEVRLSGFGYFFDSQYLNLPLLGTLGFSALFLLTTGDWQSRLRWLRFLYAGAAVAGIGLVLLQALQIGAYCWLCLLVDASSVASAFCILLIPLSPQGTTQEEGLKTWGWVGLLALGLCLPFAWMWLKAGPGTPPAIAARARETADPTSRAVPIIEFADFECPYCRKLHPILKDVIERNRSAVRLVRIHKPLASHPHAVPAALAAVCAELAGKGEEMADALFSGPLDERSLIANAQRLGIDAKSFEACRAAPDTAARVEADSKLLEPPDFVGLPTIYVGGTRVLGLAEASVYQDLIDRERGDKRPLALSGWAFIGLAAALVLFVIRLSLTRNPLP